MRINFNKCTDNCWHVRFDNTGDKNTMVKDGEDMVPANDTVSGVIDKLEAIFASKVEEEELEIPDGNLISFGVYWSDKVEKHINIENGAVEETLYNYTGVCNFRNDGNHDKVKYIGTLDLTTEETDAILAL